MVQHKILDGNEKYKENFIIFCNLLIQKEMLSRFL